MRRGDRAPDFEALTDRGDSVRLSDFLAKGPVVVFFYPRAMTRGCTAESCHFRDLAAEFAAVGATRLGISADPVERQAAFADKEGLDFPLLSDPDRRVAKAFGVKRPGPLFNRRVTFVIDTDRTVLKVIASDTNMHTHADTALAAVRARPACTQRGPDAFGAGRRSSIADRGRRRTGVLDQLGGPRRQRVEDRPQCPALVGEP